tara:strand:+ start:1144 stop:1299 length:156 start_codon:yes stop_codon:yes gene_type:complete
MADVVNKEKVAREISLVLFVLKIAITWGRKERVQKMPASIPIIKFIIIFSL